MRENAPLCEPALSHPGQTRQIVQAESRGRKWLFGSDVFLEVGFKGVFFYLKRLSGGVKVRASDATRSDEFSG